MIFLAPIPSDTSVESLNKLLEILVINFGVLIAAIVGTAVGLIKHWRDKFKRKDKENQELKERQLKVNELANEAKPMFEMIASGIIKTEPSIVVWARWWCLCANDLNRNQTPETQEMIKRIINGKDV